MKPETDQRLSDHISIGVLTRVFPPEVVDRIVTESGRTEKRLYERGLCVKALPSSLELWCCVR